jgi:hypothetical protein
MTARRDPDRLLRTYLDDGPTELPDRSYDAVRAQIDHTRQRVVFGPWRELNMSKFVVFATAAAAVLVVAAVVGLNLMPRSGDPGGVVATPTTTLPPTPAAPTPTPNATLSVGGSVVQGVDIEPGTYDAQFEGYRYTLTVPDTDFGPDVVGWESQRNSEHLAITWYGSDEMPNFAGMVIYGDVRTLYAEPCQWASSAFTPGPTVDDLANALAALDGFESTQPTDVTVGGYHGKRLQMISPADVNVSLCHGGEYRPFEGTLLGNQGETIDVRILDLHGNRVLLATHVQVGTPADAVADLNRMLDSLQIEPANP